MKLWHHRTPALELDQIQATVLRTRPEPYLGTHWLYEVSDAAAGRTFVHRLAPAVASADRWWAAHPSWIAVAFTYAGLQALGVPDSSLHSFPEPFRAGMAARAAYLMDTGANAPQHWQHPFGTGRIHIGVTVFAATEAAWRADQRTVDAALAGLNGVQCIGSTDFGQQPDDRNAFGYRDGIAQPVVEGSGVDGMPGDGAAIKAGEFIFGYVSETGVPLPVPQPDALGRNGTFVVLRKYHSHVDRFNAFLQANAASEQEQELLAAKLVGRWRSGAPLVLAPDNDNPDLGADPRRNNAFSYAKDPDGRQAPLGSHIRRVNPRDTQLRILTAVNIRRIIRRSTTYGTPFPAGRTTDDGKERGLYFIALGARAIDNVEFMQREWINEGNFVGQGRDRDPMVGQQDTTASFSVPGYRRSRVGGLHSFNTLLGGEYLFMPSLSGLAWIAHCSADDER